MNAKLIIILGLLFAPASGLTADIKEARLLLDAMEVRSSYSGLSKQLQSQFPDGDFDYFSDPEKTKKFFDYLYEEMAELYAEVYTTDELKGIRAFFQSDAGKAFLKKKPLMTKKYVALLQNMVEQGVPGLTDEGR